MDTPLQARAYGVDRSAAADRVIEYLLSGPRRLTVLYGRRGSRRRELVREWVIPRVMDRKVEAYYGECEPDLPPTVQGLRDELPVVEALQRGGMVFLGRMERHLCVPDREKQRHLAELLGGVERGEFRGSLVLLLPKRDLAQLLAFQPVAPSLMTNMLEIEVVTFRDSLRSLGDGASGLEYAPEAIEALAAEVERNSDGDGAELALAVDRGFARFKQDAGGVVTLDDCGVIGGIQGALVEYREAQMGKAAERWGEGGRKAAEIILEEVASALGEGTPPELYDLPLRLGVGASRFNEILQWLSGDGQLLREDGNRRLEIVPAELRPAIEGKTERNRRELTRASGLLREGLRSWSLLGVGLPRKRLEEIDAVRESLRAGEEEAALMVRSLLRLEGEQDMATIRYWLRRVGSFQREVSLAIEAVFAERAEVRLRAVDLLADFDEPDVRRQLHRAAIEDPDRDVRRAAVASLRNMQLDQLWPLISHEARETGSAYQESAVAALRLFPNPDAVAVLRDLVADPGESSEVRAEAIATLAALGTSEAVCTLVDIGLNDEDWEDQRRAGPALASLASRERVREAMEAIRQSTVKLEQPEPFTLGRVCGVVLRSVLSAAAIAFGGWLALIALRRYRIGLLFLGVSVSVALVFVRVDGGWVFTLALTAIYFASLLAATRAAIVDERKRTGLSPVPDPEKKRRWGLGRPLTVMLLLADLVPFFVFHGLAHLVAGRVRRAITIFALECLGILCLIAGRLYFSGSDVSTTAFSGDISKFLMYSYLGVGLVLFVGTFLWDVAAVANQVVFYTRRRNARERREILFTEMAGNRWAAEYVLDCAANCKGRPARWARRLVGRTAQAMPLEELIASTKKQSRRPRYLLESLKSLMTREETVRAVAAEWPGATPRLRRWIVDVLAGTPSERSLEQLRAFRRDLDGYGRLRYSLGVWHHRFRLWPKMVFFVGMLLFPLVVLALFEVHATFKDPVRPLLRVVQNQAALSRAALSMPDTEFVSMVNFLAKARPAKSINILVKLFRDSAPSRTMAWRQGVAGSLGIAVCQEAAPLDGAQRATLATVLADGLRQGRLEVAEGLAPIQQDAGRCQLSEGSRQELAQAASGLLKDAAGPEQAHLAIIGLDVARHTLSVAPLRSFVLQLTQPKNQERDDPSRGVAQWDELRRTALRALSSNGSGAAIAALKEIAASQYMPAPLRADADKLAMQSVQASLSLVKHPLDRGDYERAHTEGMELLNTNPQGPLRFELLGLLGEASYRLELAPGGSTADWNSRAIDHFEAAKRIKPLNTDWRRMLAHSYALLAVRKKQANDYPGAFQAAGRAIKEDADYADGYCVQAWLMQANHQDQASLEYALTAVQKEPQLAWSYDLVQDAYLNQVKATTNRDVQRQKLTEGTEKLEQLSQRYREVMWPSRRLVHLYHDFVSDYDPERAFARTYEIYLALDKQFESRLSETEKLDMDANYLESRLTTGHYQDVIEIGAQLDKRLPRTQYELRIPVNILRYAALVMRGDNAGALAQLRHLESVAGNMPKESTVGWVFNGSLRYLRARAQGNVQQRLVELVEAANLLQSGKGLSPAVLAANRRALQAAGAR